MWVFFPTEKASQSLYYTNMYSEFPRGGYNMQHFLKLFDHIASKSAKKEKKNSKSEKDIQMGTQMPVKIPWLLGLWTMFEFTGFANVKACFYPCSRCS